jgi:hypothetical protein
VTGTYRPAPLCPFHEWSGSLLASIFIEILTDDLDASDQDVTTIDFCLSGVAYEIDLTPANHERLKAAFAPFIRAGRRVPKAHNPHRSAKSKGKSERATSGDASAHTPLEAIVRSWWRQQHTRDLPPWRPTGPIPQRVIEAFAAVRADRQHGDAATGQQAPATPASSTQAGTTPRVLFTPPLHS